MPVIIRFLKKTKPNRTNLFWLRGCACLGGMDGVAATVFGIEAKWGRWGAVPPNLSPFFYLGLDGVSPHR
jgi:hypothetical protein